MEFLGNKVIMQQGEDFVIDSLISQSSSEYIPYVVSKQLDNPHLVLTVASTKFDKTDRYVESWWQDLTNEPRFNYTRPFGIIDEFDKDPINFEDLLNKIADEKTRADISADEPMERLYQYKVKSDNNFRYCYTTDKVDIVVGYELRVRFNIPAFLNSKPISAGTGNWTPQDYKYQVTLVSGQLMIDTLIEAIDCYRNINWDSNMPRIDDEKYPTELSYKDALEKYLESNQNLIDLFNKIKQNVPDFFQTDITYDSKLGRIWSTISILKPTELIVNSNLRVLI